MSRPLIVKPLPLPPPPNSLVAVDRAIDDLRRGGPVVITAADGSRGLVLAAEAATGEGLSRLQRIAGNIPKVAVSSNRAAVLGIGGGNSEVVLLSGAGPFSADDVMALADPLGAGRPTGLVTDDPPAAWAAAAVALVKLARLLPAAVVAPLAEPVEYVTPQTQFALTIGVYGEKPGN